MQILIDSREQTPLEFTHEFITETKRIKLDCGDYTCMYKNGYVPPVCFERKSIGDLYGTLSGGYDRFKREIERARDNNIKLILIVEGSLSKVLKGYEQSERQGISIIKQMFTLWVRYGLVPVFSKDRVEMATFITEYYLAIGRNLDHSKTADGINT